MRTWIALVTLGLAGTLAGCDTAEETPASEAHPQRTLPPPGSECAPGEGGPRPQPVEVPRIAD